MWENEEWKIEANYDELKQSISIEENIDKIQEFSPIKYAPFNSVGRGNQGYLFEIGKELGEYLLKLIKEKNKIEINLANDWKEKEEIYIKEIEELITREEEETEKERIVKSRIGQGLFRDKLLTKGCKCHICGVSMKSLLIASHCKPWKISNNKERLDINNGLLLCANHDALFDKGLIAFNNDGKIIISNTINKEEYKLINIAEDIKINLDDGQVPYIAYHREKQFIDNKIESKEIEVSKLVKDKL